MRIPRLALVGAACVLVGLATASFDACQTSPADLLSWDAVLSFPDEGPDGGPTPLLPLDVTDGFPVRVAVTSTVPNLQGPLTAHVWLQSGPPVVGGAGMAVTDTMLTLEPLESDGGSSYGVATLNVPGPGVFAVFADVGGVLAAPRSVSVGPTSPDGGVLPLLAAFPSLAEPDGGPITWVGTSPRYSICVSTAATRGTVVLTADDTVVLGATGAPLTATVIPGPCDCAGCDAGTASAAHANFDVAILPPIATLATLQGRPIGDDNASNWQATASIQGTGAIVQFSSPIADGGQLVAGGTTYTVSTRALLQGAAVQGLPVTFSATPSGGTTAPAPATVNTNAIGVAATEVVVPPNVQMFIVVSGGGGIGGAIVPEVASTISLSPPVVAGTQGLASGELVQVSTVAMVDGGTGGPLPGLSVTFSTTTAGVTFAPASPITTGDGGATSYAVLPYNQPSLVLVSGGNTAATAVSPIFAPGLQIGLQEMDASIDDASVAFAYQVNATVFSASDVGIPGIPVVFSMLGPSQSLSLAPGPTANGTVTVVTNDAGVATAYAYNGVSSGAGVIITATALGTVATAIVP